MKIRILPSNQTPGHRHTHEVEIIDDGENTVTVEEFQDYGEVNSMAAGDAGSGRFDQDHTSGKDAYNPPRRAVRDDINEEGWPSLTLLNAKRSYDEYQEVSLTSRRNLETRMGEISLLAQHNITNAHTNDQNIQALAVRAINNALSHDTAINQQQIRHADLAIDRHWNGIARFQTLRAADEHVAGDPHSHSGSKNSPEEQLS